MAITLVQNRGTATGQSVTARTLAYSSNVTAGDLLLVAVSIFGTAGTPTISDSQGNTYTKINSTQIGNAAGAYLYAAVAGSSGANTVTFTPPASWFVSWAIFEYSGNSASPNDSSAAANGNGTTASPGSVAVNNANSLVFGVGATQGNSQTYTPNTGFTLEYWQTSTGIGIFTEDGIFSSAATPSATISGSAVNWAVVGASFKPTAGATGGPWPWFFDEMAGGTMNMGMSP